MSLARPVDRVRRSPRRSAAGAPRQVRPPEQVGGGADDGQQVVEVVGDAAGELADGLHLLRLPQRLLLMPELGRAVRHLDLEMFVQSPQFTLRLPALCDVEHGADHPQWLAIRAAHHVATVEHIGVAAVGAPEAILVGPAVTTSVDHRVNGPGDPFPVLGVDMLEPPAAWRGQTVQPVTISIAQRLVPFDAIAPQVPVPHGVVGRPHRQVVALLAGPQRRLGFPPVGDVEDELDHLVADPPCREQAPPTRAVLAVELLFVRGGLADRGEFCTVLREDAWNSGGVSSCQVLPITSSWLKPVMCRKASFTSVRAKSGPQNITPTVLMPSAARSRASLRRSSLAGALALGDIRDETTKSSGRPFPPGTGVTCTSHQRGVRPGHGRGNGPPGPRRPRSGLA